MIIFIITTSKIIIKTGENMIDTMYIKEFETRFVKLFENEVAPKIKQFDIDRKKEKEKIEKNSIWIYAFFGLVGLIYFAYVSMVQHQISVKVVANIVIWAVVIQKAYAYMLKKQFEMKLKERIMPVLMGAFGNFRWVKEEIISLHEIAQSKMFKIPPYSSKSDDDCFIGSYKDIPIKISESIIGDGQTSVSAVPKEFKFIYDMHNAVVTNSNSEKEQGYKGVFILLEIPKRFTGHTVVTIPEYKRAVPYDEVKLEDVEFSRQFYVGSTDQVEARYLLTTAFMQRFKNIQNIFGGKYITCSFLNSSLLIFVPTDSERDLFSIGSLDENVADPKQFGIMLKEIISIFELIEELKLYQNTGL